MAPLRKLTLLRWSSFTLVMTAASFVPYSAIAMISVLDNWHGIVQYLGFALAGLLQGALIGFGQALSLRNTVIAVPGKQWVLVTALGAGAMWMIALIPGFFVTPDFGNIFVAIIAAIFLIAVLTVFPYVQTRVLRYRIRAAWRWIPITVASWLVGALIFGLFTVLVRGEDTSLFLTIFVMTVGGTVALLAATVVQGYGLRRLSFDAIAHPRWGNILPDTPRVIAARKRVGAASVKAQAKAKVASEVAKKKAGVVAKSASRRASSAASKAASRVKKKR
jgi:hypothetical protein